MKKNKYKENIGFIADIVGLLSVGYGLYRFLVHFSTTERADNFMKVLKQPVNLPIWLFVIIIIILAFSTIRSLQLRRTKKTSNFGTQRDIKAPISSQTRRCEILLFENKPKMITSEITASVERISSEFLQAQKGSFSTWIYLHSAGEGIRNLKTNRYILSHDTFGGNHVKLNEAEKPVYINVFALMLTLDRFWQLWLSDEKGNDKQWRGKDSDALTHGWHHFLIRWDHACEIFELLVDGGPFIKATDYITYWPKAFYKNVHIGTWPNLYHDHFINTWLCRTRATTEYLGDDFLIIELNMKDKLSIQ